MTNLLSYFRMNRESLLMLLSCVIVLAAFVDPCLAVDPDMQALVIDNGGSPPNTGFQAVPEPATAFLFATGIGGLILATWRRRKK